MSGMLTRTGAIVLMGWLLACAATTARGETVDLNTADAETLARVLNGVGIVVAQEIVSFREANGPFARVDDLVLVRGIGEALLERNRASMTVNSETPPDAKDTDRAVLNEQ
jgi:competence ComEA-like helix-hairpin-helix protein